MRTLNDVWAFVLMTALIGQYAALMFGRRTLLFIAWVPSVIQIAGTICFRGCPLRKLEKWLRRRGNGRSDL